ncbi:LysR substrate-binding domain-containing protein [Mesorhizobium sp. M0847]|uniref:LysR substrate-binding domain-containing protein n=1 Tax=Mesorhizobium sp. M0847 TaxID=2957011 RepID=UPI00333779C6
MTASVEIAQTLLPPVIAAFRKAYPAVAVDLVVTDRVADLVADGIDLAVRVGPLRDSSLISRAFVTGPSGLFASQAYLDRRGTPVSLEQLEHHDLIAPQQGMGATAADAGGRPEDRC